MHVRNPEGGSTALLLLGGVAVAAGAYFVFSDRGSSSGSSSAPSGAGGDMGDSNQSGDGTPSPGGGGAGANYSPVQSLPISEWSMADAKGAVTPPQDRTSAKAIEKPLHTFTKAQRSEALPWFAQIDATLQTYGADMRYVKAEDLCWASGVNGWMIPDKSLWPNMAPTTWIFGWLCDQLGYVPWITSGYRSVQYDVSRGYVESSGVSNSQHHWFSALDLTLPTTKRSDQERARFKKLAYRFYRESGALRMGLGNYANSPNTVHIDTGGGPPRPNKWGDWTPYA